MIEPSPTPIRWSRAWHAAHLGPDGFYLRNVPAGHFATEAQSGPLVEALAVMIDDRARELASGDPLEVIDIGAGSGELLIGLAALFGDDARLRFTGVDVRARPGDLPESIDWIVGQAPGIVREVWPEGITGIVIAHEWLDDLPVDVVARDENATLRHVLVDPATGRETMGDAVDPASDTQQWLAEWWGPVIDRAEIGIHRDAAWREICALLRAGTALAIDYGHTRGERDRFATGTITGFLDGATHWPIPDGSMNLTAHVVWDSLAAVTDPPGHLRTQQESLGELLPVVSPPDRVLAGSHPELFTAQLQRHSQRARLLERSTGVSWLRVEVNR